MHDLTAFANRLRKVLPTRKSWAKRAGTEAFRLYEADIPELRYIVDMYLDHAVIYDRSNDTAELTEAEIATLQQICADALKLPLDHIHLKLRRRMRRDGGAQQYEKLGEGGAGMVVKEGAACYQVNLTDYVDTGLFLDHRPLRAEFRQALAGKRFLNLFCYTGAVSVAAAQGGARVTSVDMSNTYLDWARENFRLNGLDPESHVFIRDDVLQVLQAGPEAAEEGAAAQFDIIFLDPPTFSNSKRMDQTFDVQRDHLHLIDLTMRFLAPGGVLYFSTNRKFFVLDAALFQRFNAVDITERTVPEDFRDRKIHQCFTVQRR